ncbi:hypothetical protein SAMN02982996_01191 [Lonsdalea quercina]|uniref:Uncharacterized protein n=1 Tax=Lonsdalea quercina TaxID=71657 RepID=A0A1H3ZHL3_9GAMM|nr:hypothetical protein SAMN02982996_01191 [Lonsdalea quercina]
MLRHPSQPRGARYPPGNNRRLRLDVSADFHNLFSRLSDAYHVNLTSQLRLQTAQRPSFQRPQAEPRRGPAPTITPGRQGVPPPCRRHCCNRHRSFARAPSNRTICPTTEPTAPSPQRPPIKRGANAMTTVCPRRDRSPANVHRVRAAPSQGGRCSAPAPASTDSADSPASPCRSSPNPLASPPRRVPPA